MLSDEEIKNEAIWAIRRSGMRSELLRRTRSRSRFRLVLVPSMSAVAAMLIIGLVLKVNAAADLRTLNSMVDGYYSEIPVSKGGNSSMESLKKLYCEGAYTDMRTMISDSVVPALKEELSSYTGSQDESADEISEYQKQQVLYYLEEVRWIEALSYVKTDEIETAREKMKIIYDGGGVFSEEAGCILDIMER